MERHRTRWSAPVLFYLALCQSLLFLLVHGQNLGRYPRVFRGPLETRPPGCDTGEASSASPSSPVRRLSVYYNPGEGFFLQDGCVDANATAYGLFVPSLNSTGWDTLEVGTNPGSDSSRDDNRMILFAAGLLEGLLTADRIDAHSANLMDSLLPSGGKLRSQTVPKLRQWLQDQAVWAQNFSDSNPEDPFARSVGYLLAQLQGLISGYSLASLEAPDEPEFLLHLTNAAADAFDILNTLKNEWPNWEGMTPTEFADYVARTGHCTALVRLLPGLEELMLAHNTWNAYSSTLRSFKHYNLRLANDSSFVGGRQSFSGYPGTLASLDAFYAIDNRLVLLQTTNSVFNSSLFQLWVTPQSLLAWQRVRAANQVATSGTHWAEQFSRHNSGTYNNQYMVVDLNRFKPSVALENGALTIVEQIPGLVRNSDQTAILRTGYWPSYNIPFHEDIYRLSLYPEMVRRFGPEYSYQMAARAKILRRDAANNASSLEDLLKLMRSNRYRTDPYAQGSPCKTLCCRGDLMTQQFQRQGFAASAFGCYDAKVTSNRLLRSSNAQAAAAGSVWAVSGPTSDEGRLPVFSWANFSNQSISHRLLPAVYNFSWVPMKPTLV